MDDSQRPGPTDSAASTPGPLPARREDQAVADWLFSTVKDEIVLGRIAADEILVEGTIAERFGVSRGPAREALQQLRRTGFVRALPRVGYLVTAVSLRDYDEVFQVRLAVEPLATELACYRLHCRQADDTRLQELADAVSEVVNDAGAGRGVRVAKLNRDFHFEIAVLSGNARLERIIGPLLDDVRRIMHVLAYDESAFATLADDHPELVQCLRSGVPEEAGDLMRRQLEQTYALLRDFAVGSDIAIAPRSVATGAPDPERQLR